MARIISIELENFQSIAHSGAIEFRPITLIYGPNSAGKSAIFDALNFLRIITEEDNNENAQLELMRSCHKSTDEDGTEHYKNLKITVDLEFDWPDFFHRSDLERYGTNFSFRSDDHWYLAKESGVTKARLSYEFSPIYSGETPKFIIEDFRIEYSGAIAFRLSRSLPKTNDMRETMHWYKHENCFLEFHHGNMLCDDFLANPIDERLVSTPEEVRKSFERYLPSSDDHPFVGVTRTNGGHLVKYQICDLKSLFVGNIEKPPHTYRFDDYDRTLATARDLIALFTIQLAEIFQKMSPLVRDDRSVPTSAEASYINCPRDLAYSNLTDSEKKHPTGTRKLFRQNPDPHYEYLSKCGMADAIVEKYVDSAWSPMTELVKHLQKPKERFNKINDYLSSYLFLEKMYQVNCTNQLLLTFGKNEIRDEEEQLRSGEVLVRVSLLDAQSRRLEIKDVGSGIGFVLPVLSAICRDGLVTIQQPELHLHPALQAALADVLVDRISEDRSWNCLVETHSEHLILRLLRRIRQTYENKSQFKVTPNDIAVYYFNPLPDGTTIVQEQEITVMGDFTRDWPRGFFNEREEELFG